MPFLRKLLHNIAAALLVPLLLFEEWGWEPLAAQAAKLARLPMWAGLESWLRRLPPWAALLAFFLPMTMLLPVKLLALFLFGQGHYAGGVTLLAGAKLAGTAIVARLYQLVQPTLMHIPLFAYWHPRWTAWKDQVLLAVRRSGPWRAMRRFRATVRRRWRLFWRAG